MGRHILIRLVQAVFALVAMSVVVFVISRATGDPTELMVPLYATKEDQALLREELGLNRPLITQYTIFLRNAIRGDLGVSLKSNIPVGKLLWEQLPNSALLAGFSIGLTLLMAVPLGVVAAVRRGTILDEGARVFAVLGQALPMFLVGIVLMEIFSVRLGLLPTGRMGGLQHYLLPGFTMAWFVTAGVTRLVRSAMLEVLDSEFIKMARLMGLSEGAIVWKHALKNALIPAVTFAGMYFGFLMTGAVVVETVFAWPGIGRLAYEGILSRDFPVVQGVVLLMGTVVTLANLIVDIVYVYIDPRIRIR